ncbi:MAG: fimbrial biogenesis chaperone [Tsuneonella sp.]
MLRTLIGRAGRAALCLTAFGSLLAATPVSAQGDLLVAPTRVVINGNRGTEVILSNIGSEEATYRISLELRRMTSEGDLVDVDEDKADAAQRAALDMIRYAPHRITLPPGQPQSVRIAARAGADLPDGEYRAHLVFRAIPKPAAAPAPGEQPKGISVALIPIYGVSIPVIVRQGNIEAQVAISNAHLAQGEKGRELSFELDRKGLSSTYGEVRVSKGGKDIYTARGIAIYPEVSQRAVTLPLNADQAAMMRGPVHIEYREMPENGGAVIAALDTVLG